MLKNQKYAGAVYQFIWGILAVIQNELKADSQTGDARISAKASKAMQRVKVAHDAIDELYRANPYNHGVVDTPAGFEGAKAPIRLSNAPLFIPLIASISGDSFP